MGVYIKGMVMPYGCANCHFVSAPIYDAKGRAIYVCNVPAEAVCGKRNTDEVIALYEGASEAFPDWCPLVEVPTPHGRLIDADALADDLEYDALHFEEEHELKSNCASWLRSNATPTVIEAEGE